MVIKGAPKAKTTHVRVSTCKPVCVTLENIALTKARRGCHWCKEIHVTYVGGDCAGLWPRVCVKCIILSQESEKNGTNHQSSPEWFPRALGENSSTALTTVYKDLCNLAFDDF